MLPGSGFCSVGWVGTGGSVISEPSQRLVKGTERCSPPWGQKPTERLGRRGENTGSEQTEAKVRFLLSKLAPRISYVGWRPAG